MISKRTNRIISRVMAIVGLFGMIAILIIELGYGINVNNWFFYTAFCALFVGIMQIFRYRKADNEKD